MNTINSYDPQLCWAATLTLLHMSWIGIVVGALAFVGDRLLRSSSANRRYWFQMSGLLTLGLALPITFGAVRRSIAVQSEIAAPTPLQSINLAPSVRLKTVVEPATRPKRFNGESGEPTVAKAPPETEQRIDYIRIAREASPYAAILYCLGVAAMLLKLLLAVSGGRRLRAASRPIGDQKILDLFERQVARLALGVAPAIAVCERVAVPAVIGMLRPLIVLPASVLTGLTVDELAVVLAHELAHVRRFDHWLILIQRLVEALVFFHPAAWWISRRVQRERENCCDDLVLASGGDRLVYAASLLRVAELRVNAGKDRRTVAALALDGREPSKLRLRIARLLEIADEPSVRLSRSGIFAVVLIALLSGGLSASLFARRVLTRRDDRKAVAANLKPSKKPSGFEVRSPWRVVDLETNEPLANVAVAVEIREAQFLGTSPVLLERQTLRSDKNGRFTVVISYALRRRKFYRYLDVSVVGTLAGYATNEGNTAARLNRSTIESETLFLPKGEAISGRILKPDGSPASHQKVKAFTLVSIPDDRGVVTSRYLETRGRADVDGRFQMIVSKSGKTVVQGEPLDASPFKLELGARRGEIDEIRLEKGLALKGRVINVDGKPLAHVSVGIAEYQEPFFMNLEARRTITDADGRFVMPPMPPGTYEIAPIPDYNLIDGETRPEQLPKEDRKYLDKDGEYYIERPLPAVFPKRKITIAAGEASPEIELKAVPHVKLVARVYDAKGDPALSWSAYEVKGRFLGENWRGDLRLDHAERGAMTLLAPLGLENVEVECFGDKVWWRWNAESPRVGYQHIRLERLDKDYPKIVVQRLKSDSLEVRLKMSNGEPLPTGMQVALNYPRIDGADGGGMLEAVSPGVFRLDESLLPEREINLWVKAAGCKQLFTKSFHFTEEGQKGIIELTLQPGEGDVQGVPVVLKILDDEPTGFRRETRRFDAPPRHTPKESPQVRKVRQ